MMSIRLGETSRGRSAMIPREIRNASSTQTQIGVWARMVMTNIEIPFENEPLLPLREKVARSAG